MKYEVNWRTKFTFDGQTRQHSLVMDANTAAGGSDLGPTPKELVLAAICGCTAMDVIGLLRKSRTELKSLKITAEAETWQKHPRTFKEVVLHYQAEGPSEASEVLIDAVHKSQDLYCGVSAMIAQSCPIKYRISLNGQAIHDGQAKFNQQSDRTE